MRVLFVVHQDINGASSRYRCGHLAEALRLRGHEADVVSAQQNTVTIAHDVVVLHRLGWEADGRRFAEAARQVGATVVYSVDDLLFDLEFAFQVSLLHPDDPTHFYFHKSEVEAQRQTLYEADAALVSTEVLGQLVRMHYNRWDMATKPVQVVRNFLGQAMVEKCHPAYGKRQLLAGWQTKTTFGYLSGSPTHDHDLAEIASPLAQIMGSHPDTRLFIVGPVQLPAVLELFAAQGRVRRHPFVPWQDLSYLLANVDVNLAPLDTTRIFTHAKSEVKILEAAMIGVPTIASHSVGIAERFSNFPPGEEVVWLCRNHAEWLDALQNAAGDPYTMWVLGERACSWSGRNSRAEVVADSVTEIFAEFAALKSNTPKATAIVRLPLRTRLIRAARAREAALLRLWLRLQRHTHLAANEQRRGGTF